ncbi:MAG: hypothetical protein Q8L48_21950 [Archangium sp.]|nr:hypothetical protein [Archangium sp.]
MITVLLMMGLLAAIVSGLMLYVHQERERTIASTRSMARNTCAASGLQFARAYFARNFANWNTYLSTPAVYNPVESAWNTGFVDTTATTFWTTFHPAHPELFTDLDGDGRDDVFIYIRDNADEGLPAAEDWGRDNDQNVIVGAVCVSDTMVPRTGNDIVVVEGILSYNLPDNGYGSQANPSGGNLN